MGINKHQKGLRIESKCHKWLEDKGYVVEKQNWNQWEGKDFFGMFDRIAVRKDSILFVQIKNHKRNLRPAERDEIYRFEVPDCAKKLLMVWKDRELKPDVYDIETNTLVNI